MIDEKKSRKNMQNSCSYILLIGIQGLHPNNLLEITWAKEYSKPIIVVHFEDTPLTQTRTILANYSPVSYIQLNRNNMDAEFDQKVVPLINQYKTKR
jgi:hypothetical protein